MPPDPPRRSRLRCSQNCNFLDSHLSWLIQISTEKRWSFALHRHSGKEYIVLRILYYKYDIPSNWEGGKGGATDALRKGCIFYIAVPS